MQVGPENDGRSHQPSGKLCADAIKQNPCGTNERPNDPAPRNESFSAKAIGDDDTSVSEGRVEGRARNTFACMYSVYRKEDER